MAAVILNKNVHCAIDKKKASNNNLTNRGHLDVDLRRLRYAGTI